MTHVDDLYEPGDDREPTEPKQEPPLTLEEIEAAHALTFDKSSPEDPYQAITLLLEVAVPQMLAELRDKRQRIAEWEVLPTREEWAVTDGPAIPPAEGDFLQEGGHAERAFLYARQENGQAWRQKLTVHPPEPISPHAPF